MLSMDKFDSGPSFLGCRIMTTRFNLKCNLCNASFAVGFYIELSINPNS